MKAVRFKDVRRVETEEVEIPKLKPNHVLIRQPFTGICYRDVLTVDGHFPRARKPVVIGHEIAGTIVEVGEGVTRFKPGDSVASLIYIPCGECDFCVASQENICRNKLTYGEDVDGSYSEYILAHMNSLVKIPGGVSWEAATIAACITAMLLRAFREKANLRAGQTVGITGASGGVGIHAIQIAKAIGAKVIAITSSSWKVPKIRRMGADEVVVSSEGEFSQQIKQLTGGLGCDVMLEAVGRHTFAESLRSLKWGGRMIIVGNLEPVAVDLPLGIVILRENSIIGSLSSTKESLREALELSASKSFSPVIHKILPLEDALKGHEILKSKGAVGRILLKP